MSPPGRGKAGTDNYLESTWRGDLGTPSLLTKLQVASPRWKRKMTTRASKQHHFDVLPQSPVDMLHCSNVETEMSGGIPPSTPCPPLGKKLPTLCSY